GCPCGQSGSSDSSRKPCRCSEGQKHRYLNRISGPLMDRFDLHVHVSSVALEDLEGHGGGETSADIRRRVVKARMIQAKRQGPTLCNAALCPEDINRWCRPDGAGQITLRKAFRKMGLSARAYHRVLKVARTIADLADGDGAGANADSGVRGSEAARTLTIGPEPILEALQYRQVDRVE
ncbi:MAG: ATP-binding protein, partial [Candidatus Eisenbacteria bacterium]|nr:ATP-binding protein [Candidatus Eisenbacteria bacterium]